MITIQANERTDFATGWELRGLSSDPKPTEWEGKKIPNGTAFYEMDTAELYMYSQSDETWYKQ